MSERRSALADPLALAAVIDDLCKRAAIEDALKALRDPDPRAKATVPLRLNHVQLHTIRTALRAMAEDTPDAR
jgi:hypothetical protein